MQIFLIVIHVIARLFLIAVILLQAGRGGGISDIAGGSQAHSILGNETNVFMKRLTEVFAVIFILTSLSLGIISTHRGKSLMERKRASQNIKRNIPLPPEVQKAIKEGAEAEKNSATPAAAANSVPAPSVSLVPVPAASPAAVTPASAAVAGSQPVTQAPSEGNAK